MGIALNDEIRRLLDGRHFAVLATINPDGGPQTSVMWLARDGDEVLFSTVAGRQKHRNVERDPRASVTVIDSEDPYNYVELRGRVTTMEVDVGRAFDTGLSWKYDGRDPDPDRHRRGEAHPPDVRRQGDGLRRLTLLSATPSMRSAGTRSPTAPAGRRPPAARAISRCARSCRSGSRVRGGR